MNTQSWRKSSYSGGDGGDCIEVGWRKSSHSGGDAGACVEVYDGHPDRMRVRDSKAPLGPQLAFTSDGWTAFVSAVKTGEFGDV